MRMPYDDIDDFDDDQFRHDYYQMPSRRKPRRSSKHERRETRHRKHWIGDDYDGQDPSLRYEEWDVYDSNDLNH